MIKFANVCIPDVSNILYIEDQHIADYTVLVVMKHGKEIRLTYGNDEAAKRMYEYILKLIQEETQKSDTPQFIGWDVVTIGDVLRYSTEMSTRLRNLLTAYVWYEKCDEQPFKYFDFKKFGKYRNCGKLTISEIRGIHETIKKNGGLTV